MSPITINRLKVLGIGAIAVAPVLGSFLLYLFWSPSRYTNYGMLLTPQALPAVAMQLPDGQPFRLDGLKGRWLLVTFHQGQCDATCEKKLWIMRQVRQAQGKDVQRLERLLISPDQLDVPAAMARDYAGTWFVLARDAALAQIFSAPQDRQAHIYLVDPRGYLMMRFPQEPDPKQMIRDISRLLRYSRAG